MFVAQVRPNLELRPLEERHAAAVFRLVNRDRDDLREWLPWVDVTRSEDDTQAFIRSALERFASKGEIAAGIWYQGTFAGGLGVHPLARLYRTMEIGYWLGREFRGLGIITDCCRTVVRHVLVELEQNRVEIHCATGNTKSRAIPARLGFTHEGTLRQAQCLHGRYHDLELYSLLRSELRV
jgi:ribosomal-protein-serine acetyltransferase